MKRIIYILISTVCLSANAQNKDAVYLVPNPQTARWSYIETDSQGKETATIYNSVESFEGDGVNGSIKLRVEEVRLFHPGRDYKYKGHDNEGCREDHVMVCLWYRVGERDHI